MKSSENTGFSHDFRGNLSLLLRLNSLNVRDKVWRQSLSFPQKGKVK